MAKPDHERIFSNSDEHRAALLRAVGPSLERRACRLVWVKGDAGPREILIPGTWSAGRLAIIIEGRPLKLNRLVEWREWACHRRVTELRLECVSEPSDDTELVAIASKVLSPWLTPLPARERPAVRIGEWVSQPSRGSTADNPSLLTLHFGEAMTTALSRMDRIRSRFRALCSVSPESRAAYLAALRPFLAAASEGSATAGRTARTGPSVPRPAASARVELPGLGVPQRGQSLPRVFICGESGVGKTLFAQYLAGLDVGMRTPVVRIAIPEYLDREDMFEYDLFGYVRGAYTDGHEAGSSGLLLENVGGVVFLDEIGEASPKVQAKLLAYLDDYMVRPRGWTGTPFYCPTLVVAATNRTSLASGLSSLTLYHDAFRTDLLRRFTDRILVPPLRERAESLPYILDCLLQDPGINGEAGVTEIGQLALLALTRMHFPGNFRQLEDLVRTACARAMAEGRSFLAASDFVDSPGSPTGSESPPTCSAAEP